MTTDTVPKQVALHHRDNWTSAPWPRVPACWRRPWPPCSCVITTDAVADSAALDTALRRATAATFDRLDVDGSCSTNDTVLLLSSGASAISPSQDELDDAVRRVCDDLCAQLQADAEGVTKRVVVTVAGAAHRGRRRDVRPRHRPGQPRQDGAVRLRPELGPGAGRGGHRPGRRWIRTGSRCRSTGLRSASTVSGLRVRETWTCRVTTCVVTVDLGLGAASASIRTTDLSHAYVEENSAYSS